MMAELSPTDPCYVGSVVLRTPGLSGTAIGLRTSGAKTRGDAPRDTITSTTLSKALRGHGARTTDAVAIEGLAPVPSAQHTRGGAAAALEVDVPNTGAADVQLVLQIDEAGVVSWGREVGHNA